jgi:hypothetical protein
VSTETNGAAAEWWAGEGPSVCFWEGMPQASIIFPVLETKYKEEKVVLLVLKKGTLFKRC